MLGASHVTGDSSSGYCIASDTDKFQPVNGWNSATRRLTALALWATGAFLFFLWRNLDNLPKFCSSFLRNFLHSSSRNDVHVQVPISKALAYQVDRWFTNTRYSKPLTLLYLTVVLILLGWLSLYASGGASSYDSFWSAVAGAGIDWSFLSEQPQEEQLLVRLVAAVLSVGGMLVTALMLGIVSDAISRKVDELAKGRSAVLEVDHTLILGWNDKIFCLLDQLCNANKSVGGAAIVVLAPMEKEEMEASLAEHQVDLRGSYIICRSGNPLRPIHLHQVSVETCRSIIVLADNTDPDQSDADALRVVLGLMAVDEQLVAEDKQGLRAHMVVEICDKDNEALVQTVGEEKVITVVSHDIIGRIMIQCARQPGLSNVLEDVIGFEGNEFYMREWPQLVGHPFRDVLLCFENAVPLGVKRAADGMVLLNPEPTYEVEEGDQIIVLAEDDDTYSAGPKAVANPGVGPAMLENNPKPEKYLFCGWRRDMDDMIMVLDEFAEPGSELWLYSDTPLEERKGRLLQGGLDPDNGLRNLKLIYEHPCLFGSLVVRKKLEALDMLQFSAILILADENASGHVIADADTRNLATLLLVRHLQLDRMRSLQGLSTASGIRQSNSVIRTPRPEAAIAETRRMIKLQFTDSIRAMRRGGSLPPPPTPAAHATTSKLPLNASVPVPSNKTSQFDAICDQTARSSLSSGKNMGILEESEEEGEVKEEVKVHQKTASNSMSLSPFAGFEEGHKDGGTEASTQAKLAESGGRTAGSLSHVDGHVSSTDAGNNRVQQKSESSGSVMEGAKKEGVAGWKTGSSDLANGVDDARISKMNKTSSTDVEHTSSTAGKHTGTAGNRVSSTGGKHTSSTDSHHTGSTDTNHPSSTVVKHTSSTDVNRTSSTDVAHTGDNHDRSHSASKENHMNGHDPNADHQEEDVARDIQCSTISRSSTVSTRVTKDGSMSSSDDEVNSEDHVQAPSRSASRSSHHRPKHHKVPHARHHSLKSHSREHLLGADSSRHLKHQNSSRQLRHNDSARSLRSSGSAWYNNMQPEMRGTVVISEILDSKARQLIKRLKISEFVLSNELVSMVLAMVSENRAVNDILQELLRQEGNELYVQPPQHYLHPHETLSFYDLLARACERGEIVIGYTPVGGERATLNPPQKSAKCLKLDTVQNVIVLAMYDHYGTFSPCLGMPSMLTGFPQLAGNKSDERERYND